MTGHEAFAAFERAKEFLKLGDHAAARAVEMMPSDRQVIEQRIEAAIANSTKITKERT